MRLLVLLAAAFLAACTAVSTTDPNAPYSAVRMKSLGKGQYRISCLDSHDYCFDLAKRTCPQGYSVLSAETPPPDFMQDIIVIQCGKPIEERGK